MTGLETAFLCVEASPAQRKVSFNSCFHHACLAVMKNVRHGEGVV